MITGPGKTTFNGRRKYFYTIRPSLDKTESHKKRCWKPENLIRLKAGRDSGIINYLPIGAESES
jgi:hypothetical protein